MTDELALKRMAKCAATRGHTFTEGDHGTCEHCGLVVLPPEPEQESR